MASSGLNVGWWTPMCERWYQKRLRQLESNPPPPLLTHAKWKHNMKLERRVKTYVEATERCATEILSLFRP